MFNHNRSLKKSLNRTIIGIIIAAIVIGIFLLALTNPNLRENKETWFGFIDVTPEQNIPVQKESTLSKVICDPSYPDLCILPYPPDLNCDDVAFSNFRVLQPDPHGFDMDGNGIGCEK